MNSIPNSLHVLLSDIVDYAGLFPPSQVSMTCAVENFDRYIRSEHAWMLGRFVVPLSRLGEFSKAAKELLNGDHLWRLSVLAGENLIETLDTIDKFNRKNDGRARIETLEIKVETAKEIIEISRFVPDDLTAYFEFPPNDIITDIITALAITKQCAKIRTGGVTADAFPSTDAIVKFIRICVAANVPFKATAGLHHPLRCTKPLTYEPKAPIGTMHGFLNVFLSACLLRQNLNSSAVHRLIAETEGANFKFTDDRIEWRDQIVPTSIVETARQKNAASFGSCSFLEPIEDLQDLMLF